MIFLEQLKSYKSSILKYIIFMLILFVCLMFTNNVYALEKNFYENENGVKLTEEEYNFLSKMYWDGYQSLMTLEDYIEFKNSKVMNGDIEIKEVTYDNLNHYEIILYNLSSSDNLKTLKIFKSCSSDCLISVTAEWNGHPFVRSYDVIGAFLNGTTFTNDPTTTVATSNSKTVISDLKKESYGIGSSFLLPSGSNVTINQLFKVKKGGHVYASYQHAKSSSTLAKSKDYTFSYFGYGHVFLFGSGSQNIYDAMNGVDIAV